MLVTGGWLFTNDISKQIFRAFFYSEALTGTLEMSENTICSNWPMWIGLTL